MSISPLFIIQPILRLWTYWRYALGNVGLLIISGVPFSIFPTEHKGCSTDKKPRHDVAVYENLLLHVYCTVTVAAARQQSSVMTSSRVGVRRVLLKHAINNGGTADQQPELSAICFAWSLSIALRTAYHKQTFPEYHSSRYVLRPSSYFPF